MTTPAFQYEFKDGERVNHVKGPVVDVIDGVNWTERPNPHPIVSSNALKVMERLQSLEDQFFARELVFKRPGSKIISYESCPKGSTLSSKEHKTSIPGPFHNCLFDHTGSGSDYSSIPVPGFGTSTPGRADLKSPRSSKRTKVREDCDKCSSVSFTGEDPSTCYETYLRQHTYSHLQPDGPPIKKPIQHPSEPLRHAMKTAKSLDEIKKVLLPHDTATISPSTPSNWLEELKVLLDPSKRYKVYESCSAPIPKSTRPSLIKLRRGFRPWAVKIVQRAPSARQAKVSKAPAPVVRFRFSSIKLAKYENYLPLDQAGTSKEAAALDGKFGTDRNRYLKGLPNVANRKESSEGQLNNDSGLKAKTSKTLAKGSGDSNGPSTSKRAETEAQRQKELSALLAKPKQRVKKAIRKKLSTTNKDGEKNPIKKSGKKKTKAPKPVREGPSGSGDIPKAPKQKLSTTKKKKKSKPVVHKGFGFEFKSKTKAKPTKPKKGQGEGPFDKYRESIIKMLEKQEAEKSREIQGENDVDEGGDTERVYQKKKIVRQPISLRPVKTRVKKKIECKTTDLENANEPMIVLYKKEAPVKLSKKATTSVSTQVPSSKEQSVQQVNQQNSREKLQLPPQWVKKNWLVLPVGVKETLMPSPRNASNAKPKAE